MDVNLITGIVLEKKWGGGILYSEPVRTRFDLNPEQEWIQAHVAQTINL